MPLGHKELISIPFSCNSISHPGAIAGANILGPLLLTWFNFNLNTKLLVSLCPSVCPASHVRSVVPTVLVGSSLYLYILSSNLRMCVLCKFHCKIFKIWTFGNFVNFDFVLFWLGISQNAGVLVVLVVFGPFLPALPSPPPPPPFCQHFSTSQENPWS